MSKSSDKTIRDVIAELLSKPIEPQTLDELSEGVRGLKDGMTNDEGIAAALVYRALRGDTPAVKYLAEVMRDDADVPRNTTLTLRVVK